MDRFYTSTTNNNREEEEVIQARWLQIFLDLDSPANQVKAPSCDALVTMVDGVTEIHIFLLGHGMVAVLPSETVKGVKRREPRTPPTVELGEKIHRLLIKLKESKWSDEALLYELAEEIRYSGFGPFTAIRPILDERSYEEAYEQGSSGLLR